MSDSSPNESIKSVFMRAIEIADAQERQTFIEQACGADESKLAWVQQLLTARDRQDRIVLDELVDWFEDHQSDEMLSPTEIWPEPLDVGKVVQIDRYKIRELIGVGGMGAVYIAQQEQPVRRTVALKVMRAGIASQEMMARFSAERQALAMMDHPHIAKVIDGGTTAAGQPYLVMELVRGIPITHYADTHQLDPIGRLQLFMKVCRAVQHAHRKGVIHRDLKPANILVAEIDGEAVPKVIDFGLAKALDQPLTENTIYTGFAQLMGTPMYMSPEQAEMGVTDIDTRSDVYTLGVLLYELMVGSPPFDRETFRKASFDEVRRIIRDVHPLRPSDAIKTREAKPGTAVTSRRGSSRRKLHETVRGELDWLIMKALEKDRTRRYGTATELADDIQRFLNGETVLACPPSRLYQFRKAFQRHRWAIVTATLVLLSLLTTSVVSTWQVIEVRRAKLASEVRQRQANYLLESNLLQVATSAFRDADLVQLKQLTRVSNNQRLLSSVGTLGMPSAFAKFLYSAANPVPLASMKFASPVHEIAISTAGTEIVCVREDGEVLLLKLNGSTIERRLLGSHAEPVHAVAFSPDASLVVSGSRSGVIKCWDVERATCVYEKWLGLTGIESLVWSPDGETVAAGARYSGVWIGDADGNEKFRIENDQRHESLLFSLDSSELLVPTRTGIQVWDVASATQTRSIDTAPFENIRTMCWAGPNRQWLIAGERYLDSLAIFDRKTGVRRGSFNVSAAYAKSLAASADGMWLAAGYGDGRVQVIQLNSADAADVPGKVHVQWMNHEQDDARLAVSWLGDGSHRFVTADNSGAVQLWSRQSVVPRREFSASRPLEAAYLLDNSPEPVPILRDSGLLQVPIEKFTSHAADGLVAVAGSKQIAVVSLRTHRPLATLGAPLEQHQYLSLSRDASRLAVVGAGQVCVWKSLDRWAHHELIAKFAVDDGTNVVFADDNQTLVCGNEAESRVQELNIKSGQIRNAFRMPKTDIIAISNDERLIAAGNGLRLIVWDRQSSRVLLDIHKKSSLWGLCFLADDRVLISGHNDGRLMAWHVPTGQPLGVLYHPRVGFRRPRGIQVSADGLRIMALYPSENGFIPVLLGVNGLSGDVDAHADATR